MGEGLSNPKNGHDALSQEVEVAINKKAQELYEKRIAPYAKNLSVEQKQAIIRFQKLIFILDHHYEQNRDIDPMVLNSFWVQIEQALSDMGVEPSAHAALLQDIKDYAAMEAVTRKGMKLADYDIRSFYFKKSCDVRMQRHLIRYLTKQPDSSLWDEMLLDVLEEIEDDIDDLEEDRNTPFSGNRLLEILNSGDVGKLDEYTAFVKSLPRAPVDLVQKIEVSINKLKTSLKNK